MLRPLTLSHVAYTYPNQGEPLFEDVTLTFAPGWTAITGDNGIGKSTLARCALGMIPISSGNIMPTPSSLVVAYCPQSIADPPANLNEFCADWSQLAIQLRSDLRIEEDWLYRYAELSGGQARRVHIACALARQADVVVLDEPTNHCDAYTRSIIAQTLQHVTCVGILISHDIELMDQVVQQCAVFERVHIQGENRIQVQMYSGNYTQTQEHIAIKHNAQQQALVQHANAMQSLQRAQQQAFAKVQHAQTQKHARIDMHDHDARAARKLAKATSLDSGVSQEYARFRTKIQNLEQQHATLETAAKRYSGQIRYASQASSRTVLISLPQGSIAMGTDYVLPNANRFEEQSLRVVQAISDRQNTAEQSTAAQSGTAAMQDATDTQTSILHCTDARWYITLQSHQNEEQDTHSADTPITHMQIPAVSIGATDHIAITGSNGLGKSTLLRALIAALGQESDPVPALIIEQTVSQSTIEHALEELRQLPKEQQSEVLSNIAQLNTNPDHILSGNALSPGEARKLLLCLGLAHAPQLIILDEPTNHLDISSTQVLASVLHDFPGAVVVASHNEFFLRAYLQA